MSLKDITKNIIRSAWVYGAFFGFMPPYVFTLITISSYPDFRSIYYLRLLIAIIVGALVGGFSTSIAVKYALKLIKRPNFILCLFMGLILGGICGALTMGSTPLMLLISSTDINWAINVIIRAIIAGIIMGGTAGAFFGIGINYYLKEKTKR